MRQRVIREQVFEEKVATEPEPLTSEQNLKKRNLRNSNIIGDSVQRSSEAIAEVFAGVAEAFSKGFRGFGGEITAENVTRVGMSNGFVAGTAMANANFFAELSRTSTRVYEILNSAAEQKPSTTESIDYERLAKLVAAEIINAQGLTRDSTLVPPVGEGQHN